MQELRETPGGKFDVELGEAFGAETIQRSGAVSIDQLVGEDATVEVDRLAPIDIARSVPLIALCVFVQAAKIGASEA